MILWLDEQEDLPSSIALFEERLRVKLHPAAVSHLVALHHDDRVPFPRLEGHQQYLFGMVFVPSNPDNPAAHFDRVVFAATHDGAIASVTSHPTSVIAWPNEKVVLESVDTTDSTPDGGQFVLNLLRFTVHYLAEDGRNVRDLLRASLPSDALGVDLTKSSVELYNPNHLSSHQRRNAVAALRRVTPTLSAIKGEMPRMTRVASETLEILRRLVTNLDDSDLKVDVDGNERELFSRELEIYLSDILVDCRLLVATLQEAEALVLNSREVLRQLSEEEHIAAGRFTGAIASIMLLPTFIVGLYGQNFEDMPERHWAHGY
ncbi:MAG: CorA family divalent cation transporter, partial [Actinomycetota bacterium]